MIFNANKCDWTNLRNMVLLMKYSKMDRKTIKKIQDNQILHNMMVLRESSTLFMICCKLQSQLKMMLPTSMKQQSNCIQTINRKWILQYTYKIANLAEIVHTKLPVVQVSLIVVNDGTIEDNARLYSDPSGTDIHCVGFVTTGAMNLNIGKYSGIGTIIAQKWLIEENGHKLYVRNPGKSKAYSVSFRVI